MLASFIERYTGDIGNAFSTKRLLISSTLAMTLIHRNGSPKVRGRVGIGRWNLYEGSGFTKKFTKKFTKN